MELPNRKGMIKVYLSSSYTFESSSETVVPFAVRSSNEDSRFALNSDGTITCKKNMTAIVIAHAFMNSITAGIKKTIVLKNTTKILENDTYLSKNYTSLTGTSVILDVSEGDTISLAYAGTANDVMNYVHHASFLEIREL